MYAMRGISAHSNGFQTCRALHLLQMLLGALDGPGNFRARAPYPKPIPPHQVPASEWAPNTTLAHAPLGFPTSPDDLVVDAGGAPLHIDKAFSWESPIAAHGVMHMVIANAVAGDPYPIDTLMLFMANMAWNSSMNTGGTREMLCAQNADGTYTIPFIVVSDAFASETVAFADLVLPDTTYFERYDAISLLDRPISEPDAPADAIRYPILPLASGALLIVVVDAMETAPVRMVLALALILFALALVVKLEYWRFVGMQQGGVTLGQAIGVNHGVVPPRGARDVRSVAARLLDAGHMKGAFLTREFLHAPSASQRRALRTIAVIGGFAVPVVWLASGEAGWRGGVAAFVLCMLGLVCERWLFFAEARHTVRLYHGEART